VDRVTCNHPREEFEFLTELLAAETEQLDPCLNLTIHCRTSQLLAEQRPE
jgi:hypothetical protein